MQGMPLHPLSTQVNGTPFPRFQAHGGKDCMQTNII
jgi:hypothetical protein